MSFSITLQGQLVDIMGVLAKAAVADICKLFDAESALLRSEMSRSQYENKALRRKVLYMERELRTARVLNSPGKPSFTETVNERGVEHSPSMRVLEKAPHLWKDAEPIGHEADVDSTLQPVTRTEFAESMEERPDFFLVKEENCEVDSGKCDSQSGTEFGRETPFKTTRNRKKEAILRGGTPSTATPKMATRQESVLKKKASAKARLAKFREKIYSNPELLEEYRQKERERYHKRKESGKVKTVKDLTKREHEKKKLKWRQYSAKSYKIKKQTQGLLNLTPDASVSESDSSATAEINDPTPEDHIQTQDDVPTPPPPLQASTPKRKKSKVVNRLRAKLRQAEEELKKNRKELQNLNKKFRRLQARRVTVTKLIATTAKNKKVRQQKGGISLNSKRKGLLKMVHSFLHRDDVSTVVNGKSGEMRRKGVIHRKRLLCDTMANIHKRFCGENPHQNVSKAHFFKLRPFWIVRPKVADRDTCACKLHENYV